jgi:DNA-binding NarL/FixJ family response regulator
MPIDVAIVDNHPLAINGLKAMLGLYPEVVHVSATYHSGAALLEGLQRSQPEVLLLDILLPDKSGKELAPVIARTWPGVRMIALTSLDSPAVVKSMMQRGCLGYLLKDSDEKTLIDAIEQVYKGEEFIEPSLKETLLQHLIKYRAQSTDIIPELTQREKEILKLIVSEHTTQEIADKLFISFRTVENHRYSLLQKLDVKNTAGLVRMAITLGLVD